MENGKEAEKKAIQSGEQNPRKIPLADHLGEITKPVKNPGGKPNPVLPLVGPQ
jgi:hypothetical protein